MKTKLILLLLLLIIFNISSAYSEKIKPPGGLIVALGSDNIDFAAKFLINKNCIVHCLDTDPKKINKTRQDLQSKKLYGKISIDHYNEKRIPLIDNLVSLIIAPKCSVPEKEIMRVLRPSGTAVFNGKEIKKPWPDGINEWTHFLNKADNNAVAEDSKTGPPKYTQWLSHPLWTRHHDKLNSISAVVTAKARIFYIIDNGPIYEPDYPPKWTVTARDAFNGILLWEQEISSWAWHLHKFRSGPIQLQRLLVAEGDRVYTVLGLDEPVSVLDAASGKILKKLKGTEKAEEIILHKGILIVQTGEKGAEHAFIKKTKPRNPPYKDTKKITAVNSDTGKILWQYPSKGTAEIMPLSLSASEGRVFFQEKKAVISLNLKTGKEKWRKKILPDPQEQGDQKNKKKGRKKLRGRSPGWTYDTLVVKNGVVLISDNKNLYALKADSGKKLWNSPAKTPFNKTPSVDILVINGVVWTSPDFSKARDLKTGKILSSNNLQKELVTAGHHHRCYRNKATQRYIIQGYRGLEFRDTKGDNHIRHNWIRGTCQYGIMPANGLIYIPSHNCGCYFEALLHGFWALTSKQSLISGKTILKENKLKKGPAYNKVKLKTISENDWPIYRYDPARSSTTPNKISSKIKNKWQVKLSRRLSAPVIVKNTLLVSSIDTHQVLAFDTIKGTKKWSFTTGAPVDSAPTISGGCAFFGSQDGNVYCVRITDGELVWRFRAAPMELKTVALQNVTSLWPVHGSVLIKDNTVYFTAGRSTYLDNGLFLYGLDPKTGKVKYKNNLNTQPAKAMKNKSKIKQKKIPKSQTMVDYKTVKGPDKSDSFSMGNGNISDILVADNGSIYLRHKKYDKKLNPQKEFDYHLFSTSGLLDDNESHRSHLFYGRGDFSLVPVAYEWLTRGKYGGFQVPVAKFMVFDKAFLWGTVNDKKTFKYNLFSYDLSNIKEVKKDFPKLTNKEANKPKTLISNLEIHPRAMIKAGDNILIAGFPYDESIEHRYNKQIKGKGLLLQIAPDRGKIISKTTLPSPPVYDGMAVANGKLYISCEDGSLICFR